MTKECLSAPSTNGGRWKCPRAIDGNSGFRWRRAVPEGLCENSPAFQRRGGIPEVLSPEGTVESGSVALSFQPSLRDSLADCPRPGVETPGYSYPVPSGQNSVNYREALGHSFVIRHFQASVRFRK